MDRPRLDCYSRGGPCLAHHPRKSSVCPDKRRGHVGKGEGCPLAWGLLRKDL